MNRNKYPEGYLPKLRYWKAKLDEATTPHDKAHAASKLAYFAVRHTETYGPIDVESLNP